MERMGILVLFLVLIELLLISLHLVLGRIGGMRGQLQPQRKNNTDWPDHPVVPGTKPPTKECIGRDLLP